MRVAYQGLVLLVSGAAVVWRARAEAPDMTDRLRDLWRTAEPADAQHLEALDALTPQTPDEVFALAVDRVLGAAALF